MNEAEQAATDRYKAAATGLQKLDADIVVARATLEKLLQARPLAIGEVASSAIKLLTVLGGASPPDGIFQQLRQSPPTLPPSLASNRELPNLKKEGA